MGSRASSATGDGEPEAVGPLDATGLVSRLLHRCPAVLAGGAGALCIAFSAPLIALSDTSPGTASFWRCAFAVPVLASLALIDRRTGRRHRSQWNPWFLLAAGAFLGVDMMLWNRSIGEVGAGVATVVANLQVVLFPLLGRLLDREELSRRYILALPLTLAGVALAAGLGAGAYGAAPLAGALHATLSAVCYVFFLRLLRRGAGAVSFTTTLLVVTVVSALVSLLMGLAWHGVVFALSWHSVWLLALLAIAGQVVGWMLIVVAVAALPSSTMATLLLLQPIGAVLLGYVLLGQHLPAPQLVGCGLVLVSVASVARRPGAAPTEPELS